MCGRLPQGDAARPNLTFWWTHADVTWSAATVAPVPKNPDKPRFVCAAHVHCYSDRVDVALADACDAVDPTGAPSLYYRHLRPVTDGTVTDLRDLETRYGEFNK
jgi:hypothetical protein